MPIPSNEFRDRIVASHEHFVRVLAIKYAPVAGMADDIVQQVFLEFIAKYDAWDTQSDLRPLLHTMTRLVARRCWHERSRSMTPEMHQLADYIRQLAESRDVALYGEPEKAALRECLKKLPEKSRRIVEGHYLLGVSSKDIAESMQLSADAVRQALCRLRAQLRKCMEASIPGDLHA
jgi:RNA polymerase sigma-70 factor, ECF subfamily